MRRTDTNGIRVRFVKGDDATINGHVLATVERRGARQLDQGITPLHLGRRRSVRRRVDEVKVINGDIIGPHDIENTIRCGAGTYITSEEVTIAVDGDLV